MVTDGAALTEGRWGARVWGWPSYDNGQHKAEGSRGTGQQQNPAQARPARRDRSAMLRSLLRQRTLGESWWIAFSRAVTEMSSIPSRGASTQKYIHESQRKSK